MAITFLYELALVYLVYQRVDEARHLLTYLDPSLGVPLAEETYAEECSIFDFDSPDAWYGISPSVLAKIDFVSRCLASLFGCVFFFFPFFCFAS